MGVEPLDGCFPREYSRQTASRARDRSRREETDVPGEAAVVFFRTASRRQVEL